MRSCSSVCGYCGRCTDDDGREAHAVQRQCRSCHRQFWQSLSEEYVSDPLCDTCCTERDYAYRREHEAGLY